MDGATSRYDDEKRADTDEPPLTISGPAGLVRFEGHELGVSPWYAVSQERIDAFASATDDGYWIHVDPKRAAASPMGSTIAHGLLTLSLGPHLMDTIVRFEDFGGRLNYGYDRVRFPAPVPVDARIRMRLRLASVTQVEGAVHAKFAQTLELEGSPKPACVGIFLLYLFE